MLFMCVRDEFRNVSTSVLQAVPCIATLETCCPPPPQALHNKKVLSCPILDIEDDQYNGCLSVNDILRDLITSTTTRSHHCLHRPHSLQLQCWTTMSLDGLTTRAPLMPTRCSTWAASFATSPCKTLLMARGCAHGSHLRFNHNPLVTVGELWLLEADNCSTLLDLVLESLASQAIHAHHRVFIASPGKGEAVSANHGITSIALKPGLERKDSTGLRVVGVVSQSDVVGLLWKARAELEGPLSATLEDLDIAEVGCVNVLV